MNFGYNRTQITQITQMTRRKWMTWVTWVMRNERPRSGQSYLARGKQKAGGLCAAPGYESISHPSSPVGAAQSITWHRYAAPGRDGDIATRGYAPPCGCSLTPGYIGLTATRPGKTESIQLNDHLGTSLRGRQPEAIQ